MSMWNVGDRVLLSRSSEFSYQAGPNDIGTVTDTNVDHRVDTWCAVTFDNGYANSYPDQDLIMAHIRMEPEFSLEDIELARNLVGHNHG